MTTEVPQWITDKLIEIGKRVDIDQPSVAVEFEQFKPYEYLGRIHWQGWHDVCAGLAVDDHTALLKAVVMAMKYSDWDGGSVAPGIWIYNKLEEKVTSEIANEMASWIIERSENQYMPFGSYRTRESFIRNKQAMDSGTTLLALRLDDAVESSKRVREHLAQQQEIKEQRLLLKENNAANHYLRKHDNDPNWLSMLSNAENLDEIGRLKLILDNPYVPLNCFPESWGQISKSTVDVLNYDMRFALVARLSGKKSQPWISLCKKLVSSNINK